MPTFNDAIGTLWNGNSPQSAFDAEDLVRKETMPHIQMYIDGLIATDELLRKLVDIYYIQQHEELTLLTKKEAGND
jgi:hypothetical protein